jgi:hypothetical protein
MRVNDMAPSYAVSGECRLPQKFNAMRVVRPAGAYHRLPSCIATFLNQNRQVDRIYLCKVRWVLRGIASKVSAKRLLWTPIRTFCAAQRRRKSTLDPELEKHRRQDHEIHSETHDSWLTRASILTPPNHPSRDVNARDLVDETARLSIDPIRPPMDGSFPDAK